jgi:hypothetical protein
MQKPLGLIPKEPLPERWKAKQFAVAPPASYFEKGQLKYLAEVRFSSHAHSCAQHVGVSSAPHPPVAVDAPPPRATSTWTNGDMLILGRKSSEDSARLTFPSVMNSATQSVRCSGEP